MMSRDNRQILLALERQRDNCAQTAVTDDDDSLIARQMNLLEDLIRSCQRLDEDRDVVRNRIGNRNQVEVREPQEIRKGAVAPEDSEHGAIRTMARKTGGARRASAASRVDLADDAFPSQRRVLRLDHAAGEFMPRHSAILHVAARDLEVSPADAGERDADHALAARSDGVGMVAAKFQLAIENQCAHKCDRLKQKSRRVSTLRPDASWTN